MVEGVLSFLYSNRASVSYSTFRTGTVAQHLLQEVRQAATVNSQDPYWFRKRTFFIPHVQNLFCHLEDHQDVSGKCQTGLCVILGSDCGDPEPG